MISCVPGAARAAVREGRVHVVDEDTSSRWSPRIVDFLREVAAIVAGVPDRQPTS